LFFGPPSFLLRKGSILMTSPCYQHMCACFSPLPTFKQLTDILETIHKHSAAWGQSKVVLDYFLRSVADMQTCGVGVTLVICNFTSLHFTSLHFAWSSSTFGVEVLHNLESWNDE
jgi:hypothetical protein